MRESWIYTDVSLSNGGISHRVPGMIDTGCSVCMIDSTYAVDSCHITDVKGDKMMDNTAGKSIKSSYVYLDSISFAQCPAEAAPWADWFCPTDLDFRFFP